MFIGHFAVGLAAKRAAPSASLGALFGACQLADLVWPNLVLAGIEIVEVDPGNTAFTPLNFVSYPYSHSLLALVIWGLLAGLLYARATRGPSVAGATVALVVLSHWFLDAATHRPDLPLTMSGSLRVGLGLWNSVPLTVFVELGMFAAGLLLYLRATAARDRVGSVGLWTLVAFLLATYAANIVGPMPPGPTAVAVAAEALWLIVLWGFWVDRHRASTRPNG